MNIIEVNGLSYRFKGDEQVLTNLNVHVPKGAIYGLLGANGAGKTTSLKLMLGLLKMQEGSVYLFGKNLAEERISCLSKIGSLIESPSIYYHLNATDNLLVWQSVLGCKETRIKQVLELVGLAYTGNKKVGQFSLGMKQRLAIAVALLHQPELLVLDEPTNGLDPNGIIEIRELLLRLNAELKTTIVLSSHILAEIERVVTHVGILDKGTMVFEGTLDQMMTRQQACKQVELNSGGNTRLQEVLKLQNYPFTITRNGTVLVTLADVNEIASLVRFLVDNKIDLYEVKQIKEDLESLFINIIK